MNIVGTPGEDRHPLGLDEAHGLPAVERRPSGSAWSRRGSWRRCRPSSRRCGSRARGTRQRSSGVQACRVGVHAGLVRTCCRARAGSPSARRWCRRCRASPRDRPATTAIRERVRTAAPRPRASTACATSAPAGGSPRTTIVRSRGNWREPPRRGRVRARAGSPGSRCAPPRSGRP